MDSEEFRKLLIATMGYTNQLKDKKLGSGYTDWHSKDGETGLTLTLNNGDKFSMIITKESETNV